MCEWNNGGIPVPLPDDICTWKEHRSVCIDECIVDQVKAVWTAGFETGGCCCGHGKSDPELIVANGYNDEEVQAIADVLKTNDSRPWTIRQWRLQAVNVAGAAHEELQVVDGGEIFEADSEMVTLLKELNRLGLKTTQHCSGHGDGRAYLSVDLRQAIEDVAVRMIDGYPRLVICWRREELCNSTS